MLQEVWRAWESRINDVTHPLIELWEPPPGYRLASVVATTYELQGGLPRRGSACRLLSACGLPPARGRDFRLELERALENTEVSVFFHPGRYQPGLRRSPRIDLVPLPERTLPKAAREGSAPAVRQPGRLPSSSTRSVRLVVASANLTSLRLSHQHRGGGCHRRCAARVVGRRSHGRARRCGLDSSC